MWSSILRAARDRREERSIDATADRSRATTMRRSSQYDRVFETELTADRGRGYAPDIPTGTAPRQRFRAYPLGPSERTRALGPYEP